VLVIRGKRPRGRVLWSAERARDGPAAVVERCDRDESVTETRQPAERLVAVREAVIEAHIPLILVVDFVAGPAVVVGRAGRGGQRVPLQERERDRIHAAERNRVVGKRRAARSRGGRGIEDGRHATADRFGENPLTLQQRRHH